MCPAAICLMRPGHPCPVCGRAQAARMKNTAMNDSCRLTLSSDEGLQSRMASALSVSVCVALAFLRARLATIVTEHMAAALTSEGGIPASST